MTEKRTTAATALPVSVIEARQHLRVDLDDDDVEIYNLIARATEYAEGYTGRTFCDAVWTRYIDNGWPMEIKLDRRPIVSVDSVKYIDTSGNQQTLAASQYRSDLVAGRINRAYNITWPNVRWITNAVEVAYTAGYGTTASPVGVVPEDIKHGILLMVGAWLENKEDVIKGTTAKEMPAMSGARALFDHVRVYAI